MKRGDVASVGSSEVGIGYCSLLVSGDWALFEILTVSEKLFEILALVFAIVAKGLAILIARVKIRPNARAIKKNPVCFNLNRS